ncbi:MAG: peptidoglycan recognition family protein [Atopobium minutum]|uniref:peptidoglycan recognition protein family protein n=1 Tax=Atopobium TaxID=1380 RepID=UPI0003AD77FA|nr:MULTISPECIES: peptidoglycan recognition family protein [Atopobium]ERL15963.1 N-acetylmuramoyl-L-alanine amidase [Atopobium sp. BV3Ac4]MDU4969484.1 peptidoglycan recognition family protein [Atopobium minutum]MDU5356810.1 peptidoglycan recognition family protein [Atopobium minutum]MDU5893359.1 peptidoglycan recognition family protein [Atopobium minutum]
MAWYPWKAIWASPKTYSNGRGGKKPEYIVVHYTASQASARNNCIYFSGGNRNASAHFFLDGSGTIYQSVAEGDTAWAVGNFDFNQRSISIETVSDGRDFTSAEIAELSYLVQHLMNKYGIPASHVIRHYDVAGLVRTGKTVSPWKYCPAPYINNSKWNALWKQITTNTGDDDEVTNADIEKIADRVMHKVWEYFWAGNAKDKARGVNCYDRLAALYDKMHFTGWDYKNTNSGDTMDMHQMLVECHQMLTEQAKRIDALEKKK